MLKRPEIKTYSRIFQTKQEINQERIMAGITTYWSSGRTLNSGDLSVLKVTLTTWARTQKAVTLVM